MLNSHVCDTWKNRTRRGRSLKRQYLVDKVGRSLAQPKKITDVRTAGEGGREGEKIQSFALQDLKTSSVSAVSREHRLKDGIIMPSK